MYKALKPLLFKLDPETAHQLTMKGASLLPLATSKLAGGLSQEEQIPAKSTNMSWVHRIGLAAGFDKDAKYLDTLDALGFGSIEVGGVTPNPQPGNERPRIWRMPNQRSLRNAMGFPSEGAYRVLERVKKYKGRAALGINLFKNSDTLVVDAPKSYFEMYNQFAPHADFITLNVSCPNVADAHDMGEYKNLVNLVAPFKDAERVSPIYMKISPDEVPERLDQIIELAKNNNLAGIIATNTSSNHSYDKGGISGEIITERSKKVWQHVLPACDDKFDLIAVGGFSKPSDFSEYFESGGKFVQVYTGFIYQGPNILRQPHS